MTSSSHPRTRPAGAFAAATVAAGMLVVALVLVLGGGAPSAPPPGLGSDTRVPAWIGDLLGFATRAAGAVAIGLGLFTTRWFQQAWLHTRAAAAAIGWAALSLLELGVYALEIDGRAGLFEGHVGRALAIQAALAAVAGAGWAVSAAAPGRSLAWPAAIGALLPLVLAGHARTAAQPWVAGTALSVHVIAAAAWVGGLVALAWVALGDEEWVTLVPRYSRVALVSALAVPASGVVAALGRIDVDDLLDSRYGAIVALKVVALTGLLGAGWLQRRHVVGRGAHWRGFVALAALELATMAITFGLAVGLSRTPPPGG